MRLKNSHFQIRSPLGSRFVGNWKQIAFYEMEEQ